MDKKVMMLLGGAAALVAVAVGITYMMDKEKGGSGEGDEVEDADDLDDQIAEIGAIERDQGGWI